MGCVVNGPGEAKSKRISESQAVSEKGFSSKKGEIVKKSKRRGIVRNTASGVIKLEQVKNEKTFFEVFPTLRADGELKMLFQDVEVKKITTNSTREFLHIHMVSHHLIPKK